MTIHENEFEKMVVIPPHYYTVCPDRDVIKQSVTKEKNDSEAIKKRRKTLRILLNDVKIFLIDGGMKYDRDIIGVICQESTIFF